MVDHYLEVSAAVEADIDGIEEVAFGPGRKLDVEPIYLLKREVVEHDLFARGLGRFAVARLQRRLNLAQFRPHDEIWRDSAPRRCSVKMRCVALISWSPR